MRPVVDENVAEHARGRCVQAVVAYQTVGQRPRAGVEVFLHHEQRRHNRNKDVEGEQRRLQRAVDRLVAAPGADRDTGG